MREPRPRDNKKKTDTLSHLAVLHFCFTYFVCSASMPFHISDQGLFGNVRRENGCTDEGETGLEQCEKPRFSTRGISLSPLPSPSSPRILALESVSSPCLR